MSKGEKRRGLETSKEEEDRRENASESRDIFLGPARITRGNGYRFARELTLLRKRLRPPCRLGVSSRYEIVVEGESGEARVGKFSRLLSPS